MDNRAYSIPAHIQQHVSDWKQNCRRNYEDQHGLTHTEGIVLRLVACGLQYKQVADEMSRAYRTVRRHVDVIHQKTGIKCIADLTRFAVKYGYINVND